VQVDRGAEQHVDALGGGPRRPAARPISRTRSSSQLAARAFPSSNVWNRDVSGCPWPPTRRRWSTPSASTPTSTPTSTPSATASRTTSSLEHADLHVSFDYADESDPGPYPIPSSPKIEAARTPPALARPRPVQAVGAVRRPPVGLELVGRIGRRLRPAVQRPPARGWTSADAAGLPIFPGLVRYDEVLTGSIDHAIRFTAPTRAATSTRPAT
jgi:hypothetical protein